MFHIVLGPTPSVKEGRGALLGSIRKGKALNKVEPPPASKPGLWTKLVYCDHVPDMYMYVIIYIAATS